jgi:hypothetical protein
MNKEEIDAELMKLAIVTYRLLLQVESLAEDLDRISERIQELKKINDNGK